MPTRGYGGSAPRVPHAPCVKHPTVGGRPERPQRPSPRADPFGHYDAGLIHGSITRLFPWTPRAPSTTFVTTGAEEGGSLRLCGGHARFTFM